MSKKNASPKPYWEGLATPKRVAAFANETPEVQLAVLSILRSRASDAIAVYLAAAALGVAFFGSGLASILEISPLLKSSEDYTRLFDLSEKDSARLLLVVWLILLLLGVVAFCLFGSRSTTRIREARVLLAAYENELERRHAARGMQARRWQRAHRPDWSA